MVVLVGLQAGVGVVQGVGLEPHRRKNDHKLLAIGKERFIDHKLLQLQYTGNVSSIHT